MLSLMPAPVMGAILIYVTAFMIVAGIQIILGSGIDTRKTFVIGIPLIFGLSLDIMPSMFVDVPHFLKPMFDCSLTLSTVLAVILNQVLRPPKARGQPGLRRRIPLPALNDPHGCPGAWLIWDFVRISLHQGRDGHRVICLV